MPHMGQKPGSGRTISGCMGQTYSVLIEGAEGAAGSSAIPHLGQASWLGLANLGIHRTDIGSRLGFIYLRSCAQPRVRAHGRGRAQHVRSPATSGTSPDLL